MGTSEAPCSSKPRAAMGLHHSVMCRRGINEHGGYFGVSARDCKIRGSKSAAGNPMATPGGLCLSLADISQFIQLFAGSRAAYSAFSATACHAALHATVLDSQALPRHAQPVASIVGSHHLVPLCERCT